MILANWELEIPPWMNKPKVVMTGDDWVTCEVMPRFELGIPSHVPKAGRNHPTNGRAKLRLAGVICRMAVPIGKHRQLITVDAVNRSGRPGLWFIAGWLRHTNLLSLKSRLLLYIPI